MRPAVYSIRYDRNPGHDVPFSAVMVAGKEMRERLDVPGLVSFCKTTGRQTITRRNTAGAQQEEQVNGAQSEVLHP